MPPLNLADWNAICDRCGRKFPASKLRREWTGLRVCHGVSTSDCWEPKHPQLNLRAVPDKQSVPWTRPARAITEVELTINPLADYTMPSSTFNIEDPIGS